MVLYLDDLAIDVDQMIGYLIEQNDEKDMVIHLLFAASSYRLNTREKCIPIINAFLRRAKSYLYDVDGKKIEYRDLVEERKGR